MSTVVASVGDVCVPQERHAGVARALELIRVGRVDAGLSVMVASVERQCLYSGLGRVVIA